MCPSHATIAEQNLVSFECQTTMAGVLTPKLKSPATCTTNSAIQTLLIWESIAGLLKIWG